MRKSCAATPVNWLKTHSIRWIFKSIRQFDQIIFWRQCLSFHFYFFFFFIFAYMKTMSWTFDVMAKCECIFQVNNLNIITKVRSVIFISRESIYLVTFFGWKINNGPTFGNQKYFSANSSKNLLDSCSK